jgi:carboxypeptidase Taq
MSIEAYKKLKKIFTEASISSDIEGILHWDMATMMPANARKQRGNQLAFMAKIKHALLSSQNVEDLINDTNEDSLEIKDKVNFLEMKREHLFISSLPEDLVEALSKASSTCEGLWQQARNECNFNLVHESLDEVINLTKEEAAILGDKLNCIPYEALVQKYEPLACVEDISKTFDDLKDFLINKMDIIIEKQKEEILIPIKNSISSNMQYEIKVNTLFVEAQQRMFVLLRAIIKMTLFHL